MSTRVCFLLLISIVSIQASDCLLYPIALPESLVRSAAPNQLLPALPAGAAPGQLGWLTWDGHPSEPALAQSLTPPGKSASYVNPRDPSDHTLEPGDWVWGAPGIKAGASVRAALARLSQLDELIVPVWDQVQAQGQRALYHITNFARVHLEGFELAKAESLRVRFLGWAPCGQINLPPQVDAGPDLAITLPATAQLQGKVTDDGLPRGSVLQVAWTLQSGPGPVFFTASNRTNTTARFDVPGRYLLSLVATDGASSTNDSLAVIVYPAGGNHPPTVDAGPDRIVSGTDHLALRARVSDDGFPLDQPLAIGWSQVDGPGPIVFSSTNSAETTVIFPTAGTYQLQVQATDSELWASDTIQIKVYPDNLPPKVSAGPDQSVTNSVANLSGWAFDDGKPAALALKLNWSKLSGPGEVYFDAPEKGSTTARFGAPGEYQLQFEASDGALSSSAIVRANVIGNQPQIVDAGPDQQAELNLPIFSSMPPPLPPPTAQWQYDLAQPGCNSFIRQNALAINQGILYAGGNFTAAGGDATIRYLAGASCGHWFNLDDPRYPGLEAPPNPVLATRGSELFAGAPFRDLGGDGQGDATARWDGHNWQRWGFKTISYSVAINVILASSNAVFVGGQFAFQPLEDNGSHTPTAGVPVSGNLACWNGTNWMTLGAGLADIRDRPGLQYGTVNALALGTNGDLYAGGRFLVQTPTGIATNLAHWTGQSWEPVGAGVSGCAGYGCTPEIQSLLVDERGALYVGGNFTQAGSVAAGHVARVQSDLSTQSWRWSAVGTGFNFPVNALLFWNHRLYAAGRFGQAGALVVNRVAQWDGQLWSPLGTGPNNGVNGDVSALAASESGIYLAGFFNTAGGLPANRIVKWGWSDPPVLIPPASVLITTAAATGAVVTLKALASQPCGKALTLRWNVDGGADEQTNILAAGSTAAPVEIAFTQNYPPGIHTLTITAEDGVSATRASAEVKIIAPVILNLAGAVSDDGLPAGQALSLRWDLESGPGPVDWSDPQSSLTQASFITPGTYRLRLTANDSQWSASDECIVTVRDSASTNAPPYVEAGPEQTIALAETARLDAVAADDMLPNGPLTFAWTQLSGPGQAQFTNITALKTSVAFTAPGRYLLRLTASDGQFNTSDSVVINVNAQINQPPSIQLPTHTAVMLPESVELNASVQDDGLPWGLLQVNWTQLSGPGTVLFWTDNDRTKAAFSVAGEYQLQLDVSDYSSSAQAQVNVSVFDPAPLPNVEWLAPVDGASLTAPTQIIGTASSPLFQSFQLEYCPAGSADWTTFAQSAAPVTAASLGMFDPTLLRNGTYQLRLTAWDRAGRSSTTEPVTVMVERQLKVGLFHLAFEDLHLPLSGIPITITRSYDSRDKQLADFGTGWRLAIADIRLEKNRSLDKQWIQTSTGGLFPIYRLEARKTHRITVTFPNDQLFQFVASPEPAAQFGIPISYGRVLLQPLPGTHGTLEPLSGDQVALVGSVPGPVDLYDLKQVLEASLAFEFNPTLFRFRSPEGFEYWIDEKDGLKKIIEPNGQSLTITSEGIVHSNGRQVLFTRDAQHRITAITDSQSSALSYEYQGDDLAATIDPAGHRTLFRYDDRHNLVSIRDPRGVELLQNNFDPSGRLASQTDATGQTLHFNHDLAARTETVTDRLGRTTVYQYDERGNVLQKIDPAGNRSQFVYDARDNLLSATDPLGRSTRLEYDAQGNPARLIDPLGRVTQYVYNSQRQLLSLTDPAGRVFTNQFDAAGNIISSRDPLGGVTQWTYDSAGLLAKITGPSGQSHQFNYDTNGFLVADIDATGHTVALEPDAQGNPTKIRADRLGLSGSQTIEGRFQYDPLGQLLETFYSDGTSARLEYDPNGQLQSETDPAGHQTQYQRDAQGRLTQIIQPDSTSQTFTYDAEDQLVSVTDPLGLQTRFAYDEVGALRQIIYPDGATESAQHDAAGQLICATDARGASAWIGYDLAGQLMSITNALGQVIRFTYDLNGNVKTQTDPLGHATTFEYDALGRLTGILRADGSHERYSYDVSGQLITATDPAGHSTGYSYDILGRLTAVTNALGAVSRFTYDELGQRLTQSDPNGHTLQFEYDPLGRRTRRTLPAGQTETYAYDSSDDLIEHADFNGRRTAYAYDPLHRLLQKIPDSTGLPPQYAAPVIFSYTTLGQRQTMHDSIGLSSYRYDRAGRLVEKQSPQGTLSYQYDLNGNLIRLRSDHRNGVDLAYEYDALNQLVGITDLATGARTTYQYDPVGNLGRIILPNGIDFQFSRNLVNQITNVIASRAGTVLALYSYQFDLAGRRLALNESNGRQVRWAYDAVGRLTQELIYSAPGSAPAQIDYQYDAAGNRLARVSGLNAVPSRSWTYDPNDRLLEDLYDANGNTIQGLTAVGSGSITVDAFDSENQLVDRNHGQVQFLYDGDGARVGKIVNGLAVYFLVDDLNPTGYAQVLEELDPSGQVQKRYSFGLNLISQEDLSQGQSISRFYGADGQGNIRFLSDAAGQLTDRYDYDAFGTLIAQSGLTPNCYLYQGQRWDPDLNLYHLRARYYNPQSGRFWSMDPFEGLAADPASLHKYLYCAGDPVNDADPSGFVTLSESLQVTGIGMAASALSRSLTSGWFAYVQGQDVRAVGRVAFLESLQGANEGLFYSIAPVGISQALGWATVRGAPMLMRWAPAVLLNRLSKSYRALDQASAQLNGQLARLRRALSAGEKINPSELAQLQRSRQSVRQLYNATQQAETGIGLQITRARVGNVPGLAGKAAESGEILGPPGAGQFVLRSGQGSLEAAGVVRTGGKLNRVFDSRWQLGRPYSQPMGGSFSPGSTLPFTATQAVIDRGLNWPGVVNNAKMGVIYRATQNLPAIFRTSLGGIAPEVLIAPGYRSGLQQVGGFVQIEP